MKSILIVGPLLVGIIILLYTIIANLLRLWLEHRVRMALLERLQRDPTAPTSAEDVQALLDAQTREGARSDPVDYRITGGVLAAIGLLTASGAYLLGHGATSAGVYFGGVICVVVGIILIVLGVLIRYLSKLPIDAGLK